VNGNETVFEVHLLGFGMVQVVKHFRWAMGQDLPYLQGEKMNASHITTPDAILLLLSITVSFWIGYYFGGRS
jgi:hypothetical protein